MLSSNSSLRKAAILLQSLAPGDADAMLSEMSDEQAAAVGEEMSRLGDIDPEEQESIIAEFMRLGPLIPEENPPGLELADVTKLLHSSNQRTFFAAAEAADAPAQSSSDGLVDSLRDIDPQSLASFLESEHPQAAALVLARLPASRSGLVLSRLPAALQVEAIRRMIDLHAADPQILQEIESALRQWLARQSRPQPASAGLSAVNAILKSADSVARRQILGNLSLHDRGLASRLAPDGQHRRFNFAELCQFDDDSLLRLVRAADQRTVPLAMIGAAPDFFERILNVLPQRESQELSDRFAHLGPTRLKDIDRAQDSLGELASHMLAEGRLPRMEFSHLTAVV
jgi:flagellar motor switch protein FliG